MSTSPRNPKSNANLPISKSIIFNNYSIRNIIINHSNNDIFDINSKNPNNYYKYNNQISFSPSPINTIKTFLPNNIEQSNIVKNGTSFASYKNINRINCINIERIPCFRENIEIIPNLMPLSRNEKIKAKHPQDSVKKIKVNVSNNNGEKKLKNIIYNRILKTIKSSGLENHQITREISFPNNSMSKKKIRPKKTKIIYFEPKAKLNLEEFQFGKQIGKGTFGKIFSVKWIKNKKCYAMKKEILTNEEVVEKRKDTFRIIHNFIKNTGTTGLINLYGNLCLKDNNKNNINTKFNEINMANSKYIYYELMERAERDWDKEINIRSLYKLYYTEKELINIMTQLITTLSLLQKNHITHRDIKPQNILIIKGNYKLGDFGEIRVIKREGLIVQRVRGSELYMSPIIFHGLHLDLIQVRHNTYKSDVFSLGMCLFYAASLTYDGVDSIRELIDMKKIKVILFQFLSKNYSNKLIMFILSMLEVDENKRMNFIQLEKKLRIFTVKSNKKDC